VLRVTTIHARTAGASARYYTRYLAEDGPEGDGQWLGRQADGLGLDGVVSTDDLEALLSGHDPATGTRLGTPLVDRYDAKGRLIPAVAGFDATFSAPKSLSIWWGLTGDPGLLEAHDIAVRAPLKHLERFGSTTRVRVDRARQHPDVHGLTMAAFRQATSREDDPQLHTHVVISTKVRAPDGRWMALDARYLKRHQRALGGLYQSVLRAELTNRYGVAWGPIENGQAEIVGMPRELLDGFSRRTAQVEAALSNKLAEFREREGRDPSRWERAALTREAATDTRATKTNQSVESLGRRWKDEAKGLGWTPARLVTDMRAAARSVPEREPATVADVIEQLSANGSSWTRADVLRAVCDLDSPTSQMSGHGWANAVEAACDRVIEACVKLDPLVEGNPVRSSDGRSIWIAPVEPYLTHERVLAEEERILLFAIEAHETPPQPSATLDRAGLDVLQADAAAAVAGDDRLVLLVGPAGTGKTTTLRRAADDLHRHSRSVFGVAPTAKAAKVLRDETGIQADTVAKLLYEWRSGHEPSNPFWLSPGTTLVVDEAGMAGTGALDQLVTLAVAQNWRLALVGDPRQLQAVGRGGMFDELCRVGRTHKLATIHRFRQPWERAASLQLRSGKVDAIDAYISHGRVSDGTFDDLVAAAARQWMDHTADGRTVAVVAETNEHVDVLNRAIQLKRRALGHLGATAVRLAGGETATVGDIVVTRRNDRSLRTDRGEPVRNRDPWKVVGVSADGRMTVSHLHGHGQVTLAADYVTANVRLGYAATAHGHQGDTVDVGIAIVTAATNHRSLYVGATRGREENRLLVVTDEAQEAREVLEQVLTNDRADTPAVAQRRRLAAQLPGSSGVGDDARSAEEKLAAARRALDDVKRRTDPFLRPLHEAEKDVRAAEDALRESRSALVNAPAWRRRRPARSVADTSEALTDATGRRDAAEHAAEPYLADVQLAEAHVDQAERDASIARIRERLDSLALAVPAQGIERGIGI
jgi:conjugative relaxase-like TrwC/TraI family protein